MSLSVSEVLWQHSDLLLVALGLLLGSALVSGYEVAFFAAGFLPTEHETPTKANVENRHVAFFRRKPDVLLAALLVLNIVFNIGFILLLAQLLKHLRNAMGLQHTMWVAVDAFVIAGLLLFLGEIIPKAHAAHQRAGWLKRVSILIRGLYYSTLPVSWLLGKSTRLLYRDQTPDEQQLSAAELRQAIELTSEESSPAEEKQILKGLVEISAMRVRDVMRPWPEVKLLRDDMTLPVVLSRVNLFGFSRLPVVSRVSKKVVGVLYVKDLLPLQLNPTGIKWQGLLRPAYIISENIKLNKLLNDFKAKRLHLAIVQNEQGHTVGLITLQDILELIFGTLHDEFDRMGAKFTSTSEPDVFLVDGRLPLEMLWEMLELPEAEVSALPNEQTLQTFLACYSAKTPAPYDIITLGSFEFEVLEVSEGHINQVRVRRLASP